MSREGLEERALLQRLADGPVSGDVLARTLGVTRAAVWKRLRALREAGVVIEAMPGRGYWLRQPPDWLDKDAIWAALPAACRARIATLDVAWTVDSTNTRLLQQAVPEQGCAVLLAERQTAGRGRRGRAWMSPLAAHVYLSLARRFDGGLARLGGLSLVAGIATAEAMQALGLSQVRLKWPNDLVVPAEAGIRKLGGLLVEGGGEAGGAARAVIGLGLNVRMPADWAAQLDQPWIDLATLQTTLTRNDVVACLLAHLVPALECFDRDGLTPFLGRYAALDVLAGRVVRVLGATGAIDAVVLGIAADGALRIRDAQGMERCVHAGDVSVRT